ncbi:MAG: DUF1801 domain-containing protein [Ferruginibacter sp.]
MKSTATTPETYLAGLPPDRKTVVSKLRNTILKNLPEGFEEGMGYGMLAYTVPHKRYPDGYHCTPELPLPFMNVASQKNFVAFYHMGLYAIPELLNWFTSEFPKHSKRKIDMGKSCLRFKSADDVPLELIGELVERVSVEQWIMAYEKKYKKII